jgi:CDP-glucose 4,6-dehydratase
MLQVFDGYYQGKTVLVTGDTGFKGSWLCVWLKLLGARVVGFAQEPPSQVSHYDVCALQDQIDHVTGDLRNFDQLKAAMDRYRPDIVFHLAAQALVPRAVNTPRETFDVNVMGTVNVLEAALQAPQQTSVVVVTSDKCYQNFSWEWGYREEDRLGGFEPYGASKACAELVVQCYQSRGYQNAREQSKYLPIASARAGNVIGGGDWADARLVPDLARAIAQSETLHLRAPQATRPWQHVLESLSGYLCLGAQLGDDPEQFASAWNFGPNHEVVASVGQVVESFMRYWNPNGVPVKASADSTISEAMVLSVDCSRARARLGWHCCWELEQTLEATASWYRTYYEVPGSDMLAYSQQQIQDYCSQAATIGLAWAQGE